MGFFAVQYCEILNGSKTYVKDDIFAETVTVVILL